MTWGRKALLWTIGLFVAYFIITKPVAAAGSGHGIVGLVGHAASSFATFLANL